MLSRVAWHIYWLSRYLERAENIARILDVAQSVALLPQRERTVDDALEPLLITDTLDAYRKVNPEHSAATFESVALFLTWNQSHPSSIVHCLDACRDNAKAVRGAITSEMWEAINTTWLELQKFVKIARTINPKSDKTATPPSPLSPTARAEALNQIVGSEFFEWIKQCSHLFRGVQQATLPRGQAYWFILLGMFIERADNTARLLMAKPLSQSLLQGENNTLVSNYYRLSTVLRSLSAMEAYNDIYRDALSAERVAELLLFNSALPRSLKHCLHKIADIVAELPTHHAKLARKRVALIQAQFMHDEVRDVVSAGFHDYLENFLAEHLLLAEAINHSYLEFN